MFRLLSGHPQTVKNKIQNTTATSVIGGQIEISFFGVAKCISTLKL